VCDDAVLQAVVQFGTAVYGKADPAGGVDGSDQVNSGLFHHPDFSKDGLRARVTPNTERTAGGWGMISPWMRKFLRLPVRAA